MSVGALEVTIIMPALNERENVGAAIRNTLAAFDNLLIAGEVLVIDDGSTDGTGAVVAEEMARDDRVRMVRHQTPRGLGAAWWDGVAQARGAAVCMLPGDNENDPGEILRYYSLLEHVDIVIPFVLNKQARSGWRNLLSYLFRTIINTSFLVSFNYTNGTVLYRRSLLEELAVHTNGFFYQTDMLVRFVKRRYLFAEVPYRLNERKHGASKAVSWLSLVAVVRGYLRLFADIYFRDAARSAGFAADSQTARRHGPAKQFDRRCRPNQEFSSQPRPQAYVL